jgi:predicted aspartyl protease
MGHIHVDVKVRDHKKAVGLRRVLVDKGATYTVLPEKVLKQVGAVEIPGKVEVERAIGRKLRQRLMEYR